LYVNKKQLGFPIWDFLLNVFFRGWLLAALSMTIPCLVNCFIERTVCTVIIIVFVSFITISASIYYMGLTSEEMFIVRNFINKLRKKI